MTNYLVVGKNGFVAKALHDRGLKNITFTTSNKENNTDVYLDLKHPNDFDYSILNENTIIILLAAISSPDVCSNDYDNTYAVNVTGTKEFVEKALLKSAKILFFSSDVVYGNTQNEVNEDSNTNPFGHYAEMKDEIEKAFLKEKNFKVFRFSYVLSKDDKYLKYLKNCTDNDKTAEVFHPFERKTVYIEDVLDAIEAILKRWNEFENQKFNICGSELISRKDIADYFSEASDKKLKYELQEPDENFWEARPKDINITSLYLEKLIGRKPTKIKDAINIITQGEK